MTSTERNPRTPTQLTVTFTLRAATPANAIRSAGLAAATIVEVLATAAATVELSVIALIVAPSEAVGPTAVPGPIA